MNANLNGLYQELKVLKKRRMNCSFSEINIIDEAIKEIKDKIIKEESINERIVEPNSKS